MIKLTIDNKPVEVSEGATILDAASKLGIAIPTMCHLKGYSNHPSCMVCLVMDLKTGTLQPSCAYPAQHGLEISTSHKEVFEARKDALELLLSDHVGDCEAPCRIACPAFMNIPEMNRLIATDQLDKAIEIVKEEIALPAILGYVCSAPCENACRRKPMDGTVSICQLKKYVALHDAEKERSFFPRKEKSTDKSIVILGAGVAGLSAAFHLIKFGHCVTVYEQNKLAGGSLWSAVDEGSLPEKVLFNEIEFLKNIGVQIITDYKVDDKLFEELKKANDALLIALGVIHPDADNLWGLALNNKGNGIEADSKTFETGYENVFACGSVVREQKMAIQALAQGKHAAYQLHEKLTKQKIPLGKQYFNSKFGKLKPEEFQPYLIEATKESPIKLEDKLKGFTANEAIEEAKRCMHCDCRKATDCKLRDYGQEYGVNQKNYQTTERRLVQKQFTHNEVVYETEKCIRCGLCVDIAEKDGEELGLTYVGRGFNVRIGVPFNEEMVHTLSRVAKKCAQHCPTGAIALK